jgi:hypothetical protein
MRSRRISAAFLGVVAFSIGLVACGADDQPTATVNLEPSMERTAKAARPFSGRCETSFAPPTLPPPPVIRQVDEGECLLSQLGRTSAYIVQDIDIAAGTQQSVEIALTAANGDVLHGSTAGTNTPNGSGVAFQATMTLTGGTGRFANATGQATVVGSANFQTNTASFVVDGVIAYGNSLDKQN